MLKYDHKVIKGMIKTIKKYKPIILVELNKENFGKINRILKKHYEPYLFIYEKNNFNIIDRKAINTINKRFKRSFNFSMPRNVFFIPKKKLNF